MTRTRLAFIGLGLMGLPMTLNLLKAGRHVTVWNRSREKMQGALAAGAIAAETPAAAAADSDIVLMCVMDAQAVEEVVFGDAGVAGAPGTNKVLVDHSSIRPDATREFSRRLEKTNGMQWIDAPVSGGVSGAEAGTLAIMAGGDPHAIERVRPFLAHYSSRVTRMGPAGAGQTTKLCNQVIVGSTIAVIAEAVRLAENAGVDASLLTQALAGGWADSKPLQAFVPLMLGASDKPTGAAWTMLKDLDTALDLGRVSGTPLPIAGLALQLLRIMAARGDGGKDLARLVDLYRPGQA